MHIRKITPNDVGAAEAIYESARDFMKAAGNPDQWRDGYPGKKEILADMAEGRSYVCEDAGEVVAVFYFGEGPDPTYEKIYGGKWLNDEPYSVIHRIAVKHHGRGIVDFCFSECSKIAKNLKIDTHKDNIPMQRVLLRAGFVECGTIYLKSGDARIAFQKTREGDRL